MPAKETIWNSLPSPSPPNVYQPWHLSPSPQDPVFPEDLPTHLAPSSSASYSASTDQCAHLQIIFTYLLAFFIHDRELWPVVLTMQLDPESAACQISGHLAQKTHRYTHTRPENSSSRFPFTVRTDIQTQTDELTTDHYTYASATTGAYLNSTVAVSS